MMKSFYRLLSITALLFFVLMSAFAQTEVSYQNLTKEKIEEDILPIRDVRKTALWFNIGWNGFVGVGPSISLYLAPKIATDVGIGISSVGFKLSARGRYLFSIKNFTPFVGLGFMYGMGSISDLQLYDPYNNNEPFTVKIDNSPFIQITGGFEYMAKKGFFVLFNTGYAILLKENNYTVTSGSPVPDEQKILDMSYKTGIVFEGGIGYAF